MVLNFELRTDFLQPNFAVWINSIAGFVAVAGEVDANSLDAGVVGLRFFAAVSDDFESIAFAVCGVVSDNKSLK